LMIGALIVFGIFVLGPRAGSVYRNLLVRSHTVVEELARSSAARSNALSESAVSG
jgi:hypothetical protein